MRVMVVIETDEKLILGGDAACCSMLCLYTLQKWDTVAVEPL
jgi:hypothetical protein